MKILQVYKDFYPPVKGGIESHLNLLTNGLKNSGVDVEVILSNTSIRFEEDKWEGIRIIKVPQLGRFYSAPLAPTFHRYLKRYGSNADIIHFHHPNPTAELSYSFTNLRKKVIVTYHSDIIRQDKLGKLYSPFRRMFLEGTDRIIATSPNYIKTSNVLKKFKDKCTVIPLGIDIARFSNYNDFEKINQIKQKHGNKILILFVGRFRHYKGLNILTSAMKSIDAKLFLIGTGPEEQKLHNMVEQHHLADKIFFLGELSDNEVNAYYKACDIFVLPSHLRSEAFGLVQLEAMCCRKPVISTELETGTSFVNIHQQTGIIVEPNNVIALSDAINYLIDHPEKRIQYGECGYQRVNQFFSAEKMVEKTIELYREVINEDQRINPYSFEKYRRKDFNDKKVKILRVVSRFNIGGPSIHVKNLTEGLNERKFETKLITGSVSPSEGDMSYIANFNEDIRVVVPELQREINLCKDLIALFKIIKIIRKFRPDIVHSHTSKAGTIARLAALICNFFSEQKIILVHTFHGHVLDAYFGHAKTYTFRVIEYILAKGTDRIIAISNTQKWELSNKYKIATPSKISLINLGFDLRPFAHADKLKGELRKKIDVSDDTLLIGIIGRLAPIKNHKMFIDAARLYLEKSNANKTKFIIIGDGELRKSLEKYAIDTGLKDHVLFYGWEKNIPMIYADLDILSLTSLNEGTPVSIIEAMAASVPVITTGVGGIKDLLGRIEADQPAAAFKICERGILCPKNDSTVFFNAFKFMIDSNYLLEKQRFTNARNYVLKSYSQERLLSDVETLYRRLLNAG